MAKSVTVALFDNSHETTKLTRDGQSDVWRGETSICGVLHTVVAVKEMSLVYNNLQTVEIDGLEGNYIVAVLAKQKA